MHQLRPSRTPTVGGAIGAYLSILDHSESVGTRRVYASTLRQLRTHLGADQPIGILAEADAAAQALDWFTDWRGPPRTGKVGQRTAASAATARDKVEEAAQQADAAQAARAEDDPVTEARLREAHEAAEDRRGCPRP